MKLLRVSSFLVLLAFSGVLTQTETTSESPTTTVAPNKYVCSVRGHCYKSSDHWFLCVDGEDARAGELSPEADVILKKRCPEIYSGSMFGYTYFCMYLFLPKKKEKKKFRQDKFR